MSLTGLPAGWTHGYTLFSLNTSRPVSTGNILGVEADPLLVSIFSQPAAVGNLFHFVPTGGSAFPNSAYNFPAGLVAAIKGATFDSVAFVLDRNAGTLDASNVVRFTVQ